MLSFRQYLIENSNLDIVKKKFSTNTYDTEKLVSRADRDTEMMHHLTREHKLNNFNHMDNPTVAHHMINKLAEGDPSKDKKHIGQIVDWYHKGQFRAEDLPSVHETLTHFQDVKNKDKLPDIPNPKQPGEIMKGTRIKSYSHMSWPEFRAHIKKHLNLGKDNEKEFSHPDAPVVFEKDGTKIHELKSKDASIHLGNCINTEWCTTWKNDSNQHDYYASHGSLYYIHTHDGEHYQFHPKSYQLMDTTDSHVEPSEFSHKYPELKHFAPMKHYRDNEGGNSYSGDYPFLNKEEKEKIVQNHLKNDLDDRSDEPRLTRAFRAAWDVANFGNKDQLNSLKSQMVASPDTFDYSEGRKISNYTNMRLDKEFGVQLYPPHHNPGSIDHLSQIFDAHEHFTNVISTHTTDNFKKISEVVKHARDKKRQLTSEFGHHFGHMMYSTLTKLHPEFKNVLFNSDGPSIHSVKNHLLLDKSGYSSNQLAQHFFDIHKRKTTKNV